MIPRPEQDIPESAEIQCNGCKHHRLYTATCEAFPNGIPKEIILGRHDHVNPFPGDHGIRFEAREEDGAEEESL